MQSTFPDYFSKIELMPNLNVYDFMSRIWEVDIMLPLVDETNFYDRKGYKGGKTLSSSVS